jgi:hypothetical protein
MKAISLWQPYAALIACAVKPFETRSWAPPASLIGQRIAIHASKRRPPAIELNHLRRAIEAAAPMDVVGRALDLIEAAWNDELPLGAVVCTATLSAAHLCGNLNPGSMVYVERTIGNNDAPILIEADPFGDYSRGRWAWRLDDIQLLEKPGAALGHQGFWNWEPLHISPPSLRHLPAPGGFPAGVN